MDLRVVSVDKHLYVRVPVGLMLRNVMTQSCEYGFLYRYV